MLNYNMNNNSLKKRMNNIGKKMNTYKNSTEQKFYVIKNKKGYKNINTIENIKVLENNLVNTDLGKLNLIFLSILFQKLDMCRYLLRKYKDKYIESVDKKGRTPLIFAIQFFRPEFVDLLSIYGADWSKKDNSGESANNYKYLINNKLKNKKEITKNEIIKRLQERGAKRVF